MDIIHFGQPISFRCLGRGLFRPWVGERYLSSRKNNEVTLVGWRRAWERWELRSVNDPGSTGPLRSDSEVHVISLQWRKLLTAKEVVWQYPEAEKHEPFQRWRLVAGDDGAALALGAAVGLVPLASDPPRSTSLFASGREVLEIQLVDTPDDGTTWVLERC